MPRRSTTTVAAVLAATGLAAAALIAVPTAAISSTPPADLVDPAAAVVSAADIAVAPASTPPELRKGASGRAVIVLQKALKVRPRSGYFGPVTHRAVIAFQSGQGLEATGIVGPETWAALGEDVARDAALPSATESAEGRYCPANAFTYGDGWGAPRGSRSHTGIDLMGKRGEPIFAVDAGQVTRSGYQSNGAMILDITGKKGMWFYGHFDSILVGSGERVRAGQLIGYMGDTGSPGAVHLHLELRPGGWSGGAVDAEPYVRTFCND